MTLEEGIQLAQNGDVSEMIRLGNYYFKQNTGDGIEEAAKWYEMAAQKNVVLAIHMTVICKKMLAYAGMQVVGHEKLGIDIALDDWNEACKWAEKELQLFKEGSAAIDNIKQEDALNNWNEICYYMGLCYYWTDQYDESSRCASKLTDVRAQVLLGASNLQLAKKTKEYASAFQILNAVIKNEDYAKTYKCNLEEDLYALAALQISKMYKNAGSRSDMESAVSTLRFALNAVKSEQSKQILSNELKRYQEKFFGGYRYV